MSANAGWEKVGGEKKKRNNHKENGKFTKSDKKKFAEKAPKLEDVCK